MTCRRGFRGTVRQYPDPVEDQNQRAPAPACAPPRLQDEIGILERPGRNASQVKSRFFALIDKIEAGGSIPIADVIERFIRDETLEELVEARFIQDVMTAFLRFVKEVESNRSDDWQADRPVDDTARHMMLTRRASPECRSRTVGQLPVCKSLKFIGLMAPSPRLERGPPDPQIVITGCYTKLKESP